MGGNKKKKGNKGGNKGGGKSRPASAPAAAALAGIGVADEAMSQLMTQPASVWQDAQALESLVATQAAAGGSAVGAGAAVIPSALDALLAAGGDLAALEQKLLEVTGGHVMSALAAGGGRALQAGGGTALQVAAAPPAKQTTGHARGIPKLLGQLRASTVATDDKSTLVLLSQILDITQTGDAADSVIRRENGIHLLVLLLTSGNAKIQENAAKVLNNVAMDDANKKIIAECGAIQPLVSLLSSPVLDTQFSALYALSNLAFDADNAAPIVAAGAIGPLIGLLRSPHGQRIQLSAMITLSSLLQRPPAGAGGPVEDEELALLQIEQQMRGNGCVEVLQELCVAESQETYPLKFFARKLIDALGADIPGVPGQLALEGDRPGVDQQAAATAALELLTNEQERLAEQHRARNAAAVGGIIAGANAAVGSIGAGNEALVSGAPHAPGYIHGGPGPPPAIGLPAAPPPHGGVQVSAEDALRAAQRLAWTRCTQAAAAGRSAPAGAAAGGGGHGAT